MARTREFDEEQVIQKAMEVFWKKGYASTSMRDLSQAMQINSSSLYNSIGDKHQLFMRSLRHYTDTRIKAVKKRYANFDSSMQALENFIIDAANTIITEPNSCMCVRATFEIEGDDTAIQSIINDYDNFTYQFLKSLIEDAQNENSIRIKEDAGLIADYLIGIFIGWYNSFIMYHDGKKIQNMANFIIRQLKN